MKDYIGAPLLAALQQAFPSAEYDSEAAQPAVFVPAAELTALLTFLRDDGRFGFARLENLTAVDYKTYFEMVYHLFAWGANTWITVKVKLDHEAPSVPSVTGVFPGAAFEEREVYDLMGIEFSGHPDLRRILLAEDFTGHPLRKDYRQAAPPKVPRLRREGGRVYAAD